MAEMRFGIFVPQGWRHDLVGIDPKDQWATMKRLAQRADAGPWESIWVFDHFHTVPAPTDQATHEAWSLMSAFGAVTDRVRLGQMCTCMSYRNPAYLAKVAATCDIVSGGRVEMGIGAGWYEHEWRAYGYGFPDAPDRLRMLDEGVQIMKQAWTEGKATFAGKHYQVDGAIVQPLPLQEGGIPMWIAGGGEKVTLKIAAKYADYTNFVGNTVEEFTHKSDLLRKHCDTVGTDFDKIVRSANYNITIGATEDDAKKRIENWRNRIEPHVGTKAVERTIPTLTGLGHGTPQQIVDRLGALRDAGMTYAIFNFHESAYDTSGIEMIEQEVIPHLQ